MASQNLSDLLFITRYVIANDPAKIKNRFKPYFFLMKIFKKFTRQKIIFYMIKKFGGQLLADNTKTGITVQTKIKQHNLVKSKRLRVLP